MVGVQDASIRSARSGPRPIALDAPTAIAVVVQSLCRLWVARCAALFAAALPCLHPLAFVPLHTPACAYPAPTHPARSHPAPAYPHQLRPLPLHTQPEHTPAATPPAAAPAAPSALAQPCPRTPGSLLSNKGISTMSGSLCSNTASCTQQAHAHTRSSHDPSHTLCQDKILSSEQCCIRFWCGTHIPPNSSSGLFVALSSSHLRPRCVQVSNIIQDQSHSLLQRHPKIADLLLVSRNLLTNM